MKNDVFAYFNPRTPCGVRLADTYSLLPVFEISIHAPLAGCDFRSRRGWWSRRRFQSTHPLRGATVAGCSLSLVFCYFNPRTPCGVRPEEAEKLNLPTWISIHAPLAGCDTARKRSHSTPSAFQSTHPLRGATSTFRACRTSPSISIHAPLAGCDLPPKAGIPCPANFNPRTPCGVRRPNAPH